MADAIKPFEIAQGILLSLLISQHSFQTIMSRLHLLLLLLITCTSATMAFRPSSSSSSPIIGNVHRYSTALPSVVGTTNSAVETFFQTQPYLSAFLTCSFKASAADFVTQQKGETAVDVSRNLAFLVYGGLYQGCAQHFLFNNLFPTWFGSGTGSFTVAAEVVTDMFVFGPLVCLPIAYLVKQVFCGEFENGKQFITNSMEEYKGDVLDRSLLQRYWGLWFPVKTACFTIVPVHYRIAFIAAVSFFWMMILSEVCNDNVEASSVRQVPEKP